MQFFTLTTKRESIPPAANLASTSEYFLNAKDDEW